MSDTRRRLAGGGCLLAAIFLVVSAIPGTWYGVPQSGAHLFTSAAFWPLWISRTLVPYLTTLAFALILAGLVELRRRDHLRPVTWLLTPVTALVIISFLSLLTAYSGGSSANPQEFGIIAELGLLSVYAFSEPLAALLLLGLAILGYRYLGSDSPWLGRVLVVGSLLTAVAGALIVFVVDVGPLLVSIPFAVTVAILGIDLLHNPDPVLDTETENR
jgi:hypothetical protein